MATSGALQAVNNYLVPATGTTNSYPLTGTFSSTPTVIDFRNVELNGLMFVPSGVFIDNSAGAGNIQITIVENGYVIICPPGGQLNLQYPAPIDQSVSIVGNGQATIIFVDFPVIPFAPLAASGGGPVTIADGADAALGSTTDSPAASDTATASAIAFLKRISGFTTQESQNSIGFAIDGSELPVGWNNLPQTLAYTGSVLNTIAFTNGTNTWTQTYTYTGSNLTGISGWVKS